jgi:hypothetical protein
MNTCPEGKVRNPTTNRCIKKGGSVHKSITASPVKRSSASKGITPCMKKYIDLDEDRGNGKTISAKVKQIARNYCRENPWFMEK